MKTVSVIIPAFNHALLLREAINSALNSELVKVEVIVVDDGSSDETSVIAKTFKDVKYVYQQNQGAHAAINNGISLASGDYISVLNDDDQYLPIHLSAGIANLEQFGNELFIGFADAFGSGFKLDVMQNHLKYSKLLIESLGLKESLFKINWSTSTSAFVFTKKLASRLGGFHPFKMCHDLDFLLRALLDTQSSVGVSLTPTWRYRCHETNSGSQIALLRQHAEIIYSIGHALRVLKIETNIENMSNLIDYGVSRDLMELAASKSPWISDEDVSLECSINDWVREVEQIYAVGL